MKVAVITPYYKESSDLLLRCHNSVLAQTYKNITHFMISDGFPNPDVDSFTCQHVKIPHCGDYGDTPRSIGAAVAAAQDYDAICFLDTDCWYDSDHIEEMIATAKRTRGLVITCPRNLYRMNSTFLRVDNESDGNNFNDTNCYMFIKGSYHLLKSWLFKDKELSIQGDRIVWKTIVESKISRGHGYKATINYMTTFAAHYLMAGEIPPPQSKIMIADGGKRSMMTYENFQKEVEKLKQIKEAESSKNKESSNE